MKRTIRAWLDRLSATRPTPATATEPLEALENRQLLAIDGPRITAIKADNRGLFEIHFDRAVAESSATTTSLRISSAGKDGKFGTKDDVVYPLAGFFSGADTVLTIYSPGTAVQQYRLQLLSSLGLKGANGRAVDGEVGKAGLPSGNGAPGGDLDIVTVNQSKPYVRFYTSAGNMLARLYNTAAPKTVANFLSYVNTQKFDASIFHRLVANFVLQGGSYKLSKHGAVINIQAGPTVQNEPGLHNTIGTIAMAKLDGNPNSATDGFFFNLGDNSANLDAQNGGFTVFANVQNDGSLDVLKSFNTNVSVVNASGAPNNFGGAWTTTPVINATTLAAKGNVITPSSDLILLNRVAVVQDVIATNRVASVAKAARAKPAFATAGTPVPTTPNVFASPATRHDDWL